MKGTVLWYNIKQGYGFIKGEDQKDVFVHKTEIPFWTIFLKRGDTVEYIPTETKKGVVATDIKMI
jgi:CspA family cold shock protein